MCESCGESSKIIKGLLQGLEQGNAGFLNYVENQLMKKTKSIYSKITRQKITIDWSEEMYYAPAITSVLKEDTRNFGLHVVKAITKENVFQYLLTSRYGNCT